MNLLGAVNTYICANIVLLCAAALLAAVTVLGRLSWRPVTYRHQLALGQVMAVAALLLPLFGTLMPHGNVLPKTALVWSAPSMRTGAAEVAENHRIALSAAPIASSVSLDGAGEIVGVLFLAGVLTGLIRAGVDALCTIRIIAAAQTIRHHGSVRLLASDSVSVPFCFWLPGSYFIVVPSSLIVRCKDLKWAIRHEVQHHRRQDTKWLYLYQIFKALFFWNPAAHWFERQLRDLQEFACDETLAARGRIAVIEYCQCLLRVAEESAGDRCAYVNAGMTGSAGSVLRRRVEVLLSRPPRQLRGPGVAAGCAAMLILMAATAFAFAATIDDRRVSAAAADRMAAVARQGSTFPIDVNDAVLKQLRLLLSTPDGRAFLQNGMRRMHYHDLRISGDLKRNGLPPELLAIPLVESGYRNLAADHNPKRGAGLWMFVAPTAKRFNLRVDSGHDERLDVAAETAAAIRMLSGLQMQFGDWRLAILAYNCGSTRIQDGIRATGSRDPWQLIAKGYENDPGYLARVMAAILIVKNPGVLDTR